VPGTDSCAAAEIYSIPSSARVAASAGFSGLAALALYVGATASPERWAWIGGHGTEP